MSDWSQGPLHVTWLDGGVLVRHGHTGILLDAPRGIADDASHWLGSVHAMAVSSGRMASVRGLLALLEAVSLTRDPHTAFTVLGPADDQRIPELVDVWTRGWPNRNPVHVDGLLPGDTAEVGGLPIEYVATERGEPTRSSVQSARGYAVRVHTPTGMVAWVPAAAPGPAVRRACRGALLAIVEVGIRPWPTTDRAWRMTRSQAIDLASDADTVWLVGDDGQRLDIAAN